MAAARARWKLGWIWGAANGDGFGCLLGSRGLDGIGSCSGDAALFIGVGRRRRCRRPHRRHGWQREGREAAMRLVSATATLYNTPSLSIGRAVAAAAVAAPVSKQERGRLPRFLPSFEARLLSRPLEPASTRHSAVRSERSAFTIHKKAPRRRRGDGRTDPRRERTGRLCNQANS